MSTKTCSCVTGFMAQTGATATVSTFATVVGQPNTPVQKTELNVTSCCQNQNLKSWHYQKLTKEIYSKCLTTPNHKWKLSWSFVQTQHLIHKHSKTHKCKMLNGSHLAYYSLFSSLVLQLIHLSQRWHTYTHTHALVMPDETHNASHTLYSARQLIGLTPVGRTLDFFPTYNVHCIYSLCMWQY